MNVSDACSLAVAGVTDKFCEVAEENDLSDDVAAPKFPVVVCHSPGAFWTMPECFATSIALTLNIPCIETEDEIIPYALYPDVSSSENLTEFSFFGSTATGSHAEAALYVTVVRLDHFYLYPFSPLWSLHV